jgi:hypothetical protein
MGLSSNDNIREMMKTLASNTVTLQQNVMSFQQETRSSIHNLEKQMGQVTLCVGKLEAQMNGKLPSQALNPKENISAIMLRSGKELEEQRSKQIEMEEEEEIETKLSIKKKHPSPSKTETTTNTPKIIPHSMNSSFKTIPPFPMSFSRSKKEDKEKEILEVFKKVKLNIPLLDAIKQISKYAKFLKDLCTTKKAFKLKGHETVSMGEVVSTVVQKNLPLKQKDPGAFTIPCIIGNASFKRALCDLGASISVMPKHVYDSLSLKPLNKTSIVIQLADRSFVYPLGVIEDVLVKINSLVIPCDFYILDMEHDSCDSSISTSILFGRPFLKTVNTKINCGKDTLSMEVGDEKIEFNFHDAMKYPYSNVYSITCYDQIDKCVQQVCDFDCEDGLSIALSYGYDFTKIEEMERHVYVPQNVHESILTLQALQTVHHGNVFVDLVLSYKKLLPFILHAPKLELKPLPDNLKYVFIGDNNTFPVIIAKGLTSAQEEKLVKLLCDHKMAIGWTSVNIKDISPSMCMHHILLEDNTKPTKKMQRRLNPPMMEVVKAKILKMLDVGVIYPITDSKWVAPIHLVPKKTGIMLVKRK